MYWAKSVFFGLGICLGQAPAQGDATVVDQHGALSVSGNRIVNQEGEEVQLRGMSLYWSQWQGDFYNADAVRWLVEDWKCTLVRAAMAVGSGGYLENPDEEKNKVIAVVDAAIDLGVYVIIDWHDHDAHEHEAQARSFFSEMAQRYAGVPNVIYETFNEPVLNNDENAWSSVIKPYHEAVIPAIREHTDNLIICGTRHWSQRVDEAAGDPIDGWDNIAYTLHFYAGTHGEFLMDYADEALDGGVALMVTEWGTSEASGDGHFARSETETWWQFLDERGISWTNWSVAAIEETSAALNPGADSRGNWSSGDLSPSGQFVRAELIDKYEEPVPIRPAQPEEMASLYLRAGERRYVFKAGPEIGSRASVNNIQGEVVQKLENHDRHFQWDGKNRVGNTAVPGAYSLQVQGAGVYPFYFLPQ